MRTFLPFESSLVQTEENRICDLLTNWCTAFAIADDLTIEADSEGHTDNRALQSLLPAMIALRNNIQKNSKKRTRIGAGGGIANGKSVERATTENFSVVQLEGNREVTRSLRFYNLDAIK